MRPSGIQCGFEVDARWIQLCKNIRLSEYQKEKNRGTEESENQREKQRRKSDFLSDHCLSDFCSSLSDFPVLTGSRINIYCGIGTVF